MRESLTFEQLLQDAMRYVISNAQYTLLDKRLRKAISTLIEAH